MEPSNLDSLYARYHLEYENTYTVFRSNIGFANYKLEEDLGDSVSIYIPEVYVSPDYRGQKWAAALVDQCLFDAKKRLKKPISKIYTTVGVQSNSPDASLRAITEYGFKLLSATPQLIYFYKEISNG